uniref:Uncharacterized protein n=1 Tax=Gopherus agassizii TaxID=38772 RepID=A0A452HN57_9SAUR
MDSSLPARWPPPPAGERVGAPGLSSSAVSLYGQLRCPILSPWTGAPSWECCRRLLWGKIWAVSSQVGVTGRCHLPSISGTHEGLARRWPRKQASWGIISAGPPPAHPHGRAALPAQDAPARPHGREALPLQRLRPGLQPGLQSVHALADPHRRAPLPLRLLWQELQLEARPHQAPAGAHGRASLPLHGLQQELQPEAGPHQAPAGAHGRAPLPLRPVWQELQPPKAPAMPLALGLRRAVLHWGYSALQPHCTGLSKGPQGTPTSSLCTARPKASPCPYCPCWPETRAQPLGNENRDTEKWGRD